MNASRSDYSKLSPVVLRRLEEFRDSGADPGHFVGAILRNDLLGACRHADDRNAWLLPIYVTWCANELPSMSWQSQAQVDAWRQMMAGARGEILAAFQRHRLAR